MHDVPGTGALACCRVTTKAGRHERLLVHSRVAHVAILKFGHFTFVCPVTWSLDGSEAGGGLIKTSLFFAV